MSDQRPPRLVGEERETLRALMQYQRDSVVRKVAGVDEDAARRRLVPTDTTRLWLVKWVLMHLLEETARHAGHADILRELIDGQTGR